MPRPEQRPSNLCTQKVADYLRKHIVSLHFSILLGQATGNPLCLLLVADTQQLDRLNRTREE